MSTSTGGKQRGTIGGAFRCSATSVNALPIAVTPPELRFTHWNFSSGVGWAICQLAPLENLRARTSTCAFGLFAATFRISGMASRIAVFSDCILSPAIEPEQSAIQKKCSGRAAISPPGIMFIFSFDEKLAKTTEEKQKET